MAKSQSEQKEGRSWRDLDQAVNTRTLSAQGRRRFALRIAHFVAAGLLVAGLAWGGWEVAETLTGGAGPMQDPVNAAPLKEIVLINDANGVLNQEWLERTLAVPKGVSLMELDLVKLRAKLLAVRQVRTVDLRRDFPHTLVVTLRERLPVVKIRVQVGGGPARTLLVARDGVVYDGIGYEAASLNLLPYLDGVRLARNTRGGFQPVDGMEDVANLLQAVQNNAPLHYAGWKVVSLARLAAYDEISVRTGTIPEVVFSRKINFTQQLARLDYIANYTRAQPGAVVQRVDLSLGGNVPVSFEDSSVRFVPNNTFPTSNPRTRRDL
jgi:cell division protein FtsQ